MRLWLAAFVILFSAGAAHADVLQSAFDAVDASLKSDGGLVPYQGLCRRPLDLEDSRQFVGSSIVVFVDQSDQAVLVNTGRCDGGNGSGQYLVIIQNGTANLVTDAGLADMRFLASNMYADGDSLFLYGNRWLSKDPHCCPSKKATLEYNVKTHRHKLTITGGTQ